MVLSRSARALSDASRRELIQLWLRTLLPLHRLLRHAQRTSCDGSLVCTLPSRPTVHGKRFPTLPHFVCGENRTIDITSLVEKSCFQSPHCTRNVEFVAWANLRSNLSQPYGILDKDSCDDAISFHLTGLPFHNGFQILHLDVTSSELLSADIASCGGSGSVSFSEKSSLWRLR
jgi:hypothetical protein